MKKLLIAISLAFYASCASMDAHFDVNGVTQKPRKILIGRVESRTLNYNPYAIINFRDSLRFEFFKRGYNSELLPAEHWKSSEPVLRDEAGIKNSDALNSQKNRGWYAEPNSESIKAYCEKYVVDVFIFGAISESEIGDFGSTRISTLVALLLYEKSGKKIGEIRYTTSDSTSDAAVIHDISKALVSKIHAEFR